LVLSNEKYTFLQYFNDSNDNSTPEINVLKKVSSKAYSTQEIGRHDNIDFPGEEYLFVEWKMGNYQYGGFAPEYYVLIKDGQASRLSREPSL